jgi:hypothetical protein
MTIIAEEGINLNPSETSKLTPAKYTANDGVVAQYALLTVFQGTIMFTYDGVTEPDDNTGHQLTAATSGEAPANIAIRGVDAIKNFKMYAVDDVATYITYEDEREFQASQVPFINPQPGINSNFSLP